MAAQGNDPNWHEEYILLQDLNSCFCDDVHFSDPECENCKAIMVRLKELDNLLRFPGNLRKSNGQLMCGCWGATCEGHEETLIGEAS